jgi:hypothetical protein
MLVEINGENGNDNCAAASQSSHFDVRTTIISQLFGIKDSAIPCHVNGPAANGLVLRKKAKFI